MYEKEMYYIIEVLFFINLYKFIFVFFVGNRYYKSRYIKGSIGFFIS